jgi:predicted DNA-binding antitoxin AbrB/MazE fold protein
MREDEMRQVKEAIYDGAVFRPTVPVTLKPNTRVRVTVARDVGTSAPVISFLDTASSLNMDGPADWATNSEVSLCPQN